MDCDSTSEMLSVLEKLRKVVASNPNIDQDCPAVRDFRRLSAKLMAQLILMSSSAAGQDTTLKAIKDHR
jgi:hypothetical protein